MKAIPVQVECCPGHEADGVPHRFICETSCVEVKRIMKRWVQSQRSAAHQQGHYFEILGNDGRRYRLRHERSSDQWYVEDIE